MDTLTRPANLRLAAAVASLLLVSALIVRTTDAAFTDTTSNTGNSFEAGDVEITDDLGDITAILDITYETDAADSDIGCINVTYAGSITPASITLAVATTSTAGGPDGLGNGLADDLNLQIQIGDAGKTCADFATTSADLYNGALTDQPVLPTPWTPTGGSNETRPFQVTVSHGGLNNDAQGDSATAAFTWTASS